MDDSESVIFICAGIFSLFIWLVWYARLLGVANFVSPRRDRTPLLLIPVLATIVLTGILMTLSSPDVKTNIIYILFYLVLGLAWIGMVVWAMPYFGLSARDDVVERRNRAAMFAIGGAIIGVTLCYAGGNIGSGPGWWVVIFSAGLSTAGLIVVWFILDLFTQITATITVERDQAAGIRLACYLIATGLILGRAVAGDWTTMEAAVSDFFRYGWPVIILTVIAILVENLSRPTVERPRPAFLSFGLVPGVCYIIGAVIILYYFAATTVRAL